MNSKPPITNTPSYCPVPAEKYENSNLLPRSKLLERYTEVATHFHLTPAPTAPTPRPIAIVGSPNCGKSTLFNRLTGLRQKVANFPGVTVDHHTGKARIHGHYDVDLVDLPGISSLKPRSEDERVSHDVLLILDSTHLSRHLTLADLSEAQSGTIHRLDLPEDPAHRLTELGFVPGHPVTVARISLSPLSSK